MCSTVIMRWERQKIDCDEGTLPGLSLSELAPISGHLRSISLPSFSGVTFHEVLAKSVLNQVPPSSGMPFRWSINPYRGCSHACVYCFARGSHRYLDFDTGSDFDSQIVVKTNAAEVLAKEVLVPSWQHEQVALGTNTDPYQRAEGRYQLMPGIIDVLARSRTPFSILTKGTLLRRDMPLLSEVSKKVPVSLAMSIAVGDAHVQSLSEPGVPSVKARLQTVATARDAGLEVRVFLMPILPYLADSVRHLYPLLRQIHDAGAASVLYAPLHLRKHVKPWFMEWLGEHYPEAVPLYRQLYPGTASTASKEYRRELAARIIPIIEGLGLQSRFS